jgi:hypothetical protein
MNAIALPLLMRKLSFALDELSSDQINRILKDELRFKIELVTDITKKETPHLEINVDAYVDKLNEMNDRQSGIKFLGNSTKAVLQVLAKRYQLSVDSSISKEKMVDRIVERAIGLRLRQEAFAQLN